MTKIDWFKYSSDTKEIDLFGNITEMNWEECPAGLKSINLEGNQITQINWKGCSKFLGHINLFGNQIIEMNWKGCPASLQFIDLMENNITKINWKGCPVSLEYIYLYNNITENNWKDCRNNNIKEIYPHNFYEQYLEHRESSIFIPYLPDTKPKKELHYELESIWHSCPDGIMFKEMMEDMTQQGLLV